MKTLKDKNGIEIKKDFLVEVPIPNDTDIHNHDFVGTAIDTHDEYVTVEDGDGECFDIEPERLEVLGGQAKNSKDLMDNEVEEFADREGLNIETAENFKEARQALWDMLHPKEPIKDKDGNQFFEVVWRVNLFAKDAKEAAKQALAMQQDKGSEAVVFEVKKADENGTGLDEAEQIDLIDEE